MLKGRLSINRWSNDRICISVEDDESSNLIIEIELDPANFGNAVAGLSGRPCVISVPPTYKVVESLGLKLEVKNISLDWKAYNNTIEELHALIEPYLVDGWELSSDGTKSQQHGKHKVGLRRYVKGEENAGN